MSETKNSTDKNACDKPEFMRGDVVEVFNPQTGSYQWIVVERTFYIEGAQILLAQATCFCSCWVRLADLPLPSPNDPIARRKEGE